ncbi:MAG: hypothetical protein WBF33_38700, partial [Candidatus Nitrosopolaris sp.]|jgi:hypothetical protein
MSYTITQDVSYLETIQPIQEFDSCDTGLRNQVKFVSHTTEPATNTGSYIGIHFVNTARKRRTD